MHLLFFGGSFDPPHLGHLILPRDVMEYFNFQKVIFIPAYISPFKAKEGHRASAEHRLNMVRIALNKVPYYDIETYEIQQRGVSYTYLTAEYLKRKYNLKKVHWLMGDDTFAAFDKWKNFERLKELIIPVVMVRNYSPTEIETLAKKFQLEEYLLFSSRRLEISSTEIRNRLRNGKDIRFFVPEGVYEYIKQNGLYI